jgi:peptide/nickel transport system substrate-binding protein
MDKRFGVKDFVLFLLLCLLVVTVWLAMKQFDRQFELVHDIQRQSNEQLGILNRIAQTLERGGGISNASTQPVIQGPDPFADLRKLREEGKYDQGDWLVQNLGAPVAKITPLLSTDYYAAVLEARVLESLYYRSPDTLEFTPLLATDKQISDDGLTITFQLRKGVTFSDGSPFTADDVVFTYDWIMNSKVDCPRERQGMERVKSVTKTNDYEVVFQFKEPYFLSFELAATEGILSKAFYSQYTPEEFNNSVGLLIGTGPYRLASPKEWKPTTGKIELQRNERYWGLAPSFDRLVYYQVESEATEVVMLGNGDLDILGLTPQQYRLLLQRPEITARTNHYEYTSPIAGYSFIAWNEKKNGKPSIFADKRVRQALTMLTDRQGICDTIWLGYATPAAGPFNPLSKQSDPSLEDWKYDPGKAKALLASIGFADRGNQGVLTLADGTPLSFRMSYGSKNETSDRVMKFIKDCYARAGVAMELDPVDWTIMEQRLKTRDFDAISLSWSAGIEDDIYQMFDSSQMENQADDFMSYVNPEPDAAIHSARTTVDEGKRMELWHQCQRILHEDQPYTFLMTPKALRFFDKRIQGVHKSKTGLNFVQDWNIPLPWYVPAAQQKYTR